MNTTKKQLYAGLEYSIHYSDTADSDERPEMEFFHVHLPSDLVCALVKLGTENPGVVESLLYTLSAQEVLAAQWACAVLSTVLQDGGYERSPFVYLGCQVGHLNSLMARRIADYNVRNVTLLETAEQACTFARRVIEMDAWQNQPKFGAPPSVVHGDPLLFDLTAYADEHGGDPIVIVPEVDLFPKQALIDYIEDNKDCNALYLLQGSNLQEEGEGNDSAIIRSCSDLEEYFDGAPIYSARISTPVGDRFQLVFAT